MRTFNHVGIVTTESKEGAVYNEGLSVWLTDYSKSPNRIEFLKFEKMPLLLEELSDMQINLPSEDSSRNLPFTAEVQSEESSDMRAILKYQIAA